MERGKETPYIPRNVKQIGEPAPERKIYVEDYVITYINRIFEGSREQEKVLLLFGGEAVSGGYNYIYVRGACEVKAQKKTENGNYFDGADFQKAMEEGGVYFRQLPLIGWALIRQGQPLNLEERMRNTWEAYMSRIPLFLLGDLSEKEEIFYWKYDGRVKEQPGYYIFYEKNRAMQEYLIKQKGDGKQTEKKEETDLLIENLRGKLTERKVQEKSRQNFLLYAASAFLLIVVLAIGVTLLNNNKKIAAIQTSVDSLLENLAEAEMQKQQSSDLAATIKGQGLTQSGFQSDSKTEKASGEAIAAGEPQTTTKASQTSTTAPTTTKSTTEAQTVTQPATQPTTEAQTATQPMTQSTAAPTTQATTAATSQKAAQEAQPAAKVTPKSHVVKEGETLQSISRRIYGNINMVDAICKKNNIKNPDAIFVGQEIILP